METNTIGACTLIFLEDDWVLEFHEELGLAIVDARDDRPVGLITVAAPMVRAFWECQEEP